MYTIYNDKIENRTGLLYDQMDAVRYIDLRLFKITIPQNKEKRTTFADLLFTFDKRVIIVAASEDTYIEPSDDLPQEIIDGRLNIYVSNKSDLDWVVSHYREHNSFLKTYIPVENFSTRSEAPVEFFDELDDEGAGFELKNMSAKEFRRKIVDLDKQNTSPLKDDFTFLLSPFIVVLMIIAIPLVIIFVLVVLLIVLFQKILHKDGPIDIIKR